MATSQSYKCESGFSGKRRDPRWVDRRLALSTLSGLECLGMTEDISLRGLRLCLWDTAPRLWSAISVDIAFEDRVLAFHGQVRYTLTRPWGTLLGIRCRFGNEATLRFLAKRYRHWIADRRIETVEPCPITAM